MSRFLKITLWILAVLAVIGGIWWYFSWRQVPQVSVPTASSTQQEGALNQNTGGPAGLSVGDSDAALSQDLTSLDIQLNGLASDSASVDQSLSDQPIQQGQ